MKRIRYIDSIKGFAVICVVIGHVANGYLGYRNADIVYYNIFNVLYAFHMPLFFAVSGFLFGRAYSSDEGIRKEKIKAQITNLICIYLLHSLLLGVSKMIFSQYTNNRVTAIDLIQIPIKPLELFWYLFVLIIYYFVFSREMIMRLKSAVIFFAAFVLGAISTWLPEYLVFDLKRALYYLLFFYLGIILNKKEEILEKKRLAFLLFPCIILLYIMFWNQKIKLNSILLVSQALGFTCSLFVFCVFKQYRILGENRFLRFIGRYGLEIYLLHTYILTAFRALLKQLNINSIPIILLVSSLAGVFIPIAIAAISKKLHIYDFLFSPYKRRLHGAPPQ